MRLQSICGKDIAAYQCRYKMISRQITRSSNHKMHQQVNRPQTFLLQMKLIPKGLKYWLCCGFAWLYDWLPEIHISILANQTQQQWGGKVIKGFRLVGPPLMKNTPFVWCRIKNFLKVPLQVSLEVLFGSPPISPSSPPNERLRDQENTVE